MLIFMVKKQQLCVPIDYERRIVDNKLIQVGNKRTVDPNNPPLVRAWYISIRPRDSRSVVNLIRNVMEVKDPVVLTHIKRIRKSSTDSKILECLICSDKFEGSDDLEELLTKHNAIWPLSHPKSIEIPEVAAPSKKISIEWSSRYWPQIWRGDPNDQILLELVNELNMELVYKNLNLLQNLCRECNQEDQTVITIFVNTRTHDAESRILICKNNTKMVEEDKNLLPVDHSIIQGIRKVAELTKKTRKFHETNNEPKTTDYLCTDYEIYTTHEPCSMCAMALIHSRIKTCFFLNFSPKTGALSPESGSGLAIHTNPSLNSHFTAFKIL